jgi:hypothetical protein
MGFVCAVFAIRRPNWPLRSPCVAQKTSRLVTKNTPDSGVSREAVLNGVFLSRSLGPKTTDRMAESQRYPQSTFAKKQIFAVLP